MPIADDPIVSGPGGIESDPILRPSIRKTDVPQEPVSLFQKGLARFRGTDVDDPIALGRLANTAAGGILGASLGVRTPIAPGPLGVAINPITGALAGGAVGSALGAMAPETTMEIGERLGFLPPGTRKRKGLSDEELRTVAEGEALVDFALGSTVQAAGLAMRGAGRLMAGVTRAGQDVAERAAGMGIDLPATAAGDSRFAKFFTAVFGRFPLIGTKMRRTGELAEMQIKEAVEALPERIAPVFSESQIGRDIHRNANTIVKKISHKFNAQYEEVFAAAEEADVRVAPLETTKKANEVLAKIAKETPVGPTGEATSAGKTLDKVATFVRDEIAVLETAPQTLRQMDGVMSKLDQELASLEPGQKRFASALLMQIKTAAQKDVVTNMSGEGAAAISGRLRELDREFSTTMSQLFETATAKRFQTVQRRGLRGLTADEATRTPVDELAKKVVDLDSPQAIDELSRLVSHRTMSRIAARTLEDAFQKGMKVSDAGISFFNPDAAAKAFGLDRKGTARSEAIERLLSKTSGVTMDEIRTVLDAARAMRRVEVPDVSSFIARRGTIGGAEAVLKGLMPGAALAGAGVAGGGVLGGTIGMLTFIGGGRAISHAIADPLAARSLKIVMNKQASRANRKVNAVRVLNLTVEALNEQDILPNDVSKTLISNMKSAFDAIRDLD